MNSRGEFNRCALPIITTKDEVIVETQGDREQMDLADDNEELAKVIEETVKAKGFLEEEYFISPSIISVKCLGNDKWEFLDDSLK